MGKLDDAEQLQFERRSEWRSWLRENHDSSTGVWVITYKKGVDKPSPTYEDLILEALCFGWIDVTLRRVDDERTRLYFSPRKKGGGWAATNKARILQLEAEGLMTPAGRAVIDQAKADGSWTKLDATEALVVPPELAAALRNHPGSRKHFDAFSPSARKQLIHWVETAKKAETRTRRADEIASQAQQGKRYGA